VKAVTVGKVDWLSCGDGVLAVVQERPVERAAIDHRPAAVTPAGKYRVTVGHPWIAGCLRQVHVGNLAARPRGPTDHDDVGYQRERAVTLLRPCVCLGGLNPPRVRGVDHHDRLPPPGPFRWVRQGGRGLLCRFESVLSEAGSTVLTEAVAREHRTPARWAHAETSEAAVAGDRGIAPIPLVARNRWAGSFSLPDHQAQISQKSGAEVTCPAGQMSVIA
jgi:hypothetical protein